MGILIQEVRKYIEKEYPERLEKFREKLSGSELDFIDAEISYFDREYTDLTINTDIALLESKTFESKKIRESILFIERIFEYLKNRRQELGRKLQPIKEFKLKPGVTESDVIFYHSQLLKRGWTDSPQEHWNALFNNTPLPDKWGPIRWLRTTKGGPYKGQPHRTALTAIIQKLLKVDGLKKMNQFFVDANNKPITPVLNQSVKNKNKYLY